MNIVLIGGCNWFGRNLIHKLLNEKINFHITWLDNLSSELSSRHIMFEFEYLKGDCFDFKYGDVRDYNFLNLNIQSNSIIIYNIWNQPDSIIGMTHIGDIIKHKTIQKIIYTTNPSLSLDFECLIKKKQMKHMIGIIYDGEIIGDYDIFNKRDKIKTIDYYKEIGNNVILNLDFNYFHMKDAICFIYFFLLQPRDDENMIISQPTKNYLYDI